VISTPLLGQLGFLLVLVGFACGVHPATAAHAAIGTEVANTEMPTLDGGKAQVLGNVEADVLVFFRPNQERSLGALRELAQCQKEFAGKSVRWAAIVSSSAPAASVADMMRETGFDAAVLVDRGDALYGSLGLALHPVLVVVGRDHKLAAFEPFRSVDFCALVSVRIRHLLREISDDELNRALDPPRAAEGGNGQVARRYRAFAAALFKDKNYDKALENVRKSLDRDPLLAAAHALLGEILLAQGNCADAIPAFNKALAIDPASASAKEGLERCKLAR
jgi:tetratricopeptide (TPR) repeat protein